MSDLMFYRDDIVIGSSKSSKVQYAVVGKTYESISSDSDDDTDDSDKIEAINNLKPGYVMVAWYPDGINEAVKETDLKLVDHSIIPPNIVRRKNENQLGTVIDTDILCDTCIVGTKKKLTGIKTKDLHSLMQFREDDLVVFGPWLGSVSELNTKLVIRFSNGARAKCLLTEDFIDKVDILYSHPSEEGGFVDETERFFPGQLLSGPLSLFATNSKMDWISEQTFQTKNKKALVKVVVERFEICSISIDWTQRAFSTNKDIMTQPDSNNQLPPKENGEVQINTSDEINQSQASTDKSLTLENENVLEVKENVEGIDAVKLQNVSILNKHSCHVDFKENGAQRKLLIGMDFSSNPTEMPPDVFGEENFQFLHRLSHFESTNYIPGVRLLYKLTAEDVKALEVQAKPNKTRKKKKINRKTSASSVDKKIDRNKDVSSDDEYESLRSDNETHSEEMKSKSGVNNVEEMDITKTGRKSLSVQNSDVQIGDAAEICKESKHNEELDIKKEEDAPMCNITSGSVDTTKTNKNNGDGFNWKTLSAKRQNGPNVEYEVGQIVTVELFATHTKVTVEWQDGLTTEGVPSTDLIPSNHVNDHDFCPGDFVSHEEDSFTSANYGMVISADNQTKLVQVLWFKVGNLYVEKLTLEEVSVYELCDHPSMSLRVSNIVIRVLSAVNPDEIPDDEVVGELLRITKDGQLLVRWAAGNKSLVYPFEVFSFDMQDFEDGEDSNESGSWQSCGEEEDSSLDDLELITEEDKKLEEVLGEAETCSSEERDEKNEVEKEEEKTQSEDVEDNHQEEFVSGEKSTVQLGNIFSLEKAPESHTFAPETFSKDATTFMKVLVRELKLLEKSLPSGIYVNTYEDRSDLLSVLFEGPVNTPYEDCLFAFDIFLPSNYPVIPPKVHYISHTQKLNPNLYPEGTVCLSLLGTWMGKGNEKWTKNSNLLQLLVSIQGLVFNAEPYYNEAGYESYLGTVEGLKNSRCYNEMVFIRLTQHMTSWLNRPLIEFVEISNKFCAVHVPLFIQRIENLIAHGESKFWDTPHSDHNDNKVKLVEETPSSDTVNDITTMVSHGTTGYPVLPLSKGAEVSLNSKLILLKDAFALSIQSK